LASKGLAVSAYARVDDAVRIGVDTLRVNGNPPFGPIYHFRREHFDHILAQDIENLILASAFSFTRSFAAENKLFSKSLSWKYEFSSLHLLPSIFWGADRFLSIRLTNYFECFHEKGANLARWKSKISGHKCDPDSISISLG
jgi:hypothetical protein